MNFNSLSPSKGNHIKTEIAKPKKIGKPPMEGVCTVWIFLPPGVSKKFLFLNSLMKTGNKKKVIKKAVPPKSKILSMR